MDGWQFAKDFAGTGLWQGFCRELFLLLELLLVGGLLTGFIGKSNGVRLLFWHEDRFKQLLAGLATALFISNLLLVAYLLHAGEAESWARHLPRWLAKSAAGRLACYVAGGWAALVLLAAAAHLAWGVYQRLMSVAQRRYRLVPACLRAWVISQRLLPVAADRADRVSGWPFIAGAAIGLLIATPAIGWCLFLLAERLDLARFVVAGSLQGADRVLHGLAAALALMLLGWYLFTALQKWNRLNTPATGVCLLLDLAASGYGFIRFQSHALSPLIPAWLVHPVVICGIFALIFVLAGLPRYKFRFRDLADYYPRLLSRPPLGPVRDYPRGPAPALISPGDRLRPFASGSTASGARRPLVLICASGGGLRAAVWTAAVLCELEKRCAEFPYHIRLISGASGGMVGAAYYTASLQPPNEGQHWRHRSISETQARRQAGFSARDQADAAHDSQRLLFSLADDMLSSVVKGLLFRDLPLGFVPCWGWPDRGQLLEDTWRLNMGAAWDQSLEALAAGERAGWRPSLVFSPMLVEDGRRLLISNLDLGHLAICRGPYVTADDFYSQSAFEFSRMFPEAWDKFRVATAARMSASFPYFSPAAVLPTVPRRRVVDAGYYDNYGVTVATNWLEEVVNNPDQRRLLEQYTSGVVVIEIRDGMSERGHRVQGIGNREPTTPLVRGAEELTGPPQALLSARDSVALYRNDEKLAWLGARFEAAGLGSGFFTNLLLQYDGDAPLSWYLTRIERDQLVASAARECAQPDALAFWQWWDARAKG